MDTLIGIKGNDYILLAADCYEQFSIVRTNFYDQGKILLVDDDKLILLAGPPGDREQFGEYIRKNIHFQKFKNSHPTTITATANFARQELAYFLRESPYQVDMLIAGFEGDIPKLYWIDYLASSMEVNKAVHGYGGNFVRGLIDKYYTSNITREEAIELMKKIRDELRFRFLVSQSNFVVKLIDKNGIADVKLFPPEQVKHEIFMEKPTN